MVDEAGGGGCAVGSEPSATAAVGTEVNLGCEKLLPGETLNVLRSAVCFRVGQLTN